MGRRIISSQLQTKDASETATPSVDGYFDRVVKYIPADIVGAWIVVKSATASASTEQVRSVALWILFAVFLGLTAWWILSDKHSALSLFSSILVSIVWLSTFGFQVPIHNQLQTGKEDKLIQRLVKTNWIRTSAWSLKAGLVSIDTISRTF